MAPVAPSDDLMEFTQYAVDCCRGVRAVTFDARGPSVTARLLVGAVTQLARTPGPLSMEGDRNLQDVLLRLLADAPFRHALTHVETGESYGGLSPDHVHALRSGDVRRIERFATFLARQYYGERLIHYHKYSRVLARWTGAPPKHSSSCPSSRPHPLDHPRQPHHRARHRAPRPGLSRRRAQRPALRRRARPLRERPAHRRLRPPPHPRHPPPARVPPARRDRQPRRQRPPLRIRPPRHPPAVPRARGRRRPPAPPKPPSATLPRLRAVAAGPVTVLRSTENIETLTAFLDGERPLAEVSEAAGLRPREGLATANALLDAGVLLPA